MGWIAICLKIGGSLKGGRTTVSLVFEFVALSMTNEEKPSGVLLYTVGLAFRLHHDGQENDTIVYSGFAHFCFWQCSESMFTGSLPVHEAPPINVLVSGFFGASLSAPWAFAAPFESGSGPTSPFFAFFFGLGSPKMTLLSSPFGIGGILSFLELPPRPPPLGIIQVNKTN